MKCGMVNESHFVIQPHFSGLPTDTGVLGSTSVGNRSRLLVGVGTYDCSEMGDSGLAAEGPSV